MTRPARAGILIEGTVVWEEPDGPVTVPTAVPVSDGEQVVVTDEGGRFAFRSRHTPSCVFITTPAGSRPLGGFFRRYTRNQPTRFRLVPAPGRAAPDYAFAVLADYQWEPNERLQTIISRIGADPAGPQFIVHVGDLFYMMEGGPVDVARRYYQRYAELVAQASLPVFNLIGNHDYVSGPPVPVTTPEFGDGLFEQTLGPTYYSFDWGGVHHIALNSFEMVGGTQRSRLSQRQLRWLKNDLDWVEAHKPVLLFAHRSPMQLENREALYRLLARRPVLGCFAGDWHRDAVFQCPGEPFWTAITVGPGENVHSMPPGYRIVEVHGHEMRHVYRLLGGPDELHVVRPAPGSTVSGAFDLIITEHSWSDRSAAPAYSEDGDRWHELGRETLPGARTDGCDATWARWRAHVARPSGDVVLHIRAAPNSAQGQFATLPLRLAASPIRWRCAVSQSGDPAWRSQPIVAGPLVVLGTDAGVSAFETAEGRLRWHLRLDGHWLGTPSAVENTIVATSWEGAIVRIRLSDGALLWRTHQERAIPPGQPCVAGDTLVVGGMKHDGIWDGSLSGLAIADGTLRWSHTHDRPFFATPLHDGGLVWASCGDRVLCLDGASGGAIWTYAPEHFSLYGPMVVAKQRLFAPDIDGWTYVLDLQRGEPIRRFLAPRGTGFGSDGAIVYAACGVRGLRAYHPESCRELWRVQWEGSYFAGRPTLLGDNILAPCSDGNLYLVDKATGRVRWSHQFGDIGVASVACDKDSGYMTTADGSLLAFRLPAE